MMYEITRRPDVCYNEWAVRAGYPGGLARSYKQGGAFGQSKGQKKLNEKKIFKKIFKRK